MRSTALAFATFLAFTLATAVPLRAQEIEIEEAPADEDLSGLGARPRGPQQPEILYGASGPYGIVAGTYGIEDFKNYKRDIEDRDPLDPNFLSDDVNVDNTLGFNVRGGYRWHPNLATEAEFEWLDGFELEQDPGHGGVGQVWSLTANQKAFLSTGRFQLFGVFGLGLYGSIDAEANGSDEEPQGTGFGLRAGPGFNLYFNEHFGLNMEYVYNWGTGGINDLRYSSFSWGFTFNP